MNPSPNILRFRQTFLHDNFLRKETSCAEGAKLFGNDFISSLDMSGETGGFHVLCFIMNKYSAQAYGRHGANGCHHVMIDKPQDV